MTIKEYTLQDAEAKLNEISHIALFLSSGACPIEMAKNLNSHMLDEIETLQSILSFMRVYPELKAAELADIK
ncbi:RstC protein [Vibrio vulnificus]|uniref:RstC protein n=1 Tax=Vibrio vulnificus TaxID=672 RepID=UPI001A2EA10F|nr:RstC protein [Vibrio vulnificus]EID0063028.1 RstC protein [Vibrio vulnificus]EID0719218.1 RstC protein [Vibrio vulnificus]EID0743410.1 RstC protein [Vibrio vulnificus]EJL7820287.1 RstC protein [Vibrio vulnificus]MCG6285351.1 RstC protein [Vibrio vulnificus]